MNLWILRPSKEWVNDEEDFYLSKSLNNPNPWDPWYDKTFGFVVRADSEKSARLIAADNRADEGRDAWINEKYSTCLELSNNGEAGLIIEDNYRA